jgi:hypothetical protein
MKSLRNSLLFSFSFILVLTGCGGGPSEDQQATLVAVAVEAALTESMAEIAATSAPGLDGGPVAVVTEAAAAPTETATAEVVSTPVVVYQPAGLFSDAERAILQTRVIEPYIHYHADLADHPPLVSLNMEPSDSLADFPYSANAIFGEGITNGFLIHATGGVVDWWVPDCLGPCPVSDSFRAAYPEIMAILEP